ncbi:MAG TPA: response regulator transcription factor [Bryobacteraceae bacterium]|nr:response regulator transcription factor [Bryobacteraceae bacterium]
MTAPRVLIVDDEPQTRRALRIALVAHAFEVADARSGEEALERLRTEVPDVILLDLNMPGMGGLQACREIRTYAEVPVIVVSGRKGEKDKIEALDAGADDYVTKPLSVEELVARIRSVRRRFAPRPPKVLNLGPVEIDLETHEVRRGDATVHLTAREFKLLYCLVLNAGEVVSHRRLLQAVWGPDYGDEIAYLRVFINQLRKKIEPAPAAPRYIITEPSMGYRFAGLAPPPREPVKLMSAGSNSAPRNSADDPASDLLGLA